MAAGCAVLSVQGGSSGTGGMDCVLEDVSHTMLFSVALCVWQLCVQWGFKWD